jgi:hypothetical protein
MPYKREKNFLEVNGEYHLMYLQFLKDARIWNSTGQYWLGIENTRRAISLLNGNVADALIPIRSENVYFYKYF